MTTTLPTWTLMSPAAPVGSLNNHTVSLAGDSPESIHVIRVSEPSQKRNAARDTVTVWYAKLGAPAAEAKVAVPSWRRLDDFADEQLGIQVTRAVVVPVSALTVRRHVGLAALLGLLVRRHAATQPPDDDGARARAQDEIRARLAPALAPVAAGPAVDAAHERVASIKEESARLAGDIVYRIENSALFDASVPTTHRFQLELMRWDDDSARLGPEGRTRLSFEVALAFRTAKDHAERVGLAHLPTTARPGAERAIKVARLAGRATAAGEREAAAAQLGQQLDDLALHYLPRPVEVPRMLALSRTALEAGRD